MLLHRALHRPAIEPLEARIAPALFLLQAGGVSVAGVDANDAALATFAGSGLAVVLGKGDQLVFDANGDGAFSPAGEERELARVGGVKGEVIFFFTERDGAAGFGPGDLTGLALNGGVKVSIAGTVHGPVVTLPASHDPADFFGAPLPVAGLQIQGSIEGALLASGPIRNVQVGSSGAGQPSVADGIFAGTAAGGREFSLDGGSTLLTLPDAPPGDFPGASISRVTLSAGTPEVVAGDALGAGAGGSIGTLRIERQGDDFRLAAGHAGVAPGPSGGRGGSISKIEILDASEAANFSLLAGNGGSGQRISGAGGGIRDVKIAGGTHALGDIDFTAGAGGGAAGDSALRGTEPESVSRGGAGGSISKVTISAQAAGVLTFTAGAGGNGGSIYIYVSEDRARTISTAGGRGGAISDLTVTAPDGADSITLTSGAGGIGGPGKRGGAGGSIRLLTLDNVSELTAEAGAGAAGGIGGRGGRIDDVDVVFTGLQSEMTLTAGAGADGTKATGAGGAITRITARGEHLADTVVTAGAGGSAGEESNARGATGGSIRGFLLEADEIDNVNLTAGNGGAGGVRMIYNYGGGGDPYGLPANALGPRGYYGGSVTILSSPGGRGGAVAGVTLKSLSDLTSTALIEVKAGDGGSGADRKRGGAGGSISNFSALLAANLGDLSLIAGIGGGGGESDRSIGGRGGSILKTVLTVSDTIDGDVGITAGAGGEGGRRAGAGGSVRLAALSAAAAFTPTIFAGTGVPDGQLLGVTITAPLTP